MNISINSKNDDEGKMKKSEESNSAKVVAYHQGKTYIVKLVNGEFGFTAMLNGKNVLKEDEYEGMTFLVPIDNKVSPISREQFDKYLVAYVITSSLD